MTATFFGEPVVCFVRNCPNCTRCTTCTSTGSEGGVLLLPCLPALVFLREKGSDTGQKPRPKEQTSVKEGLSEGEIQSFLFLSLNWSN